MKNKTEVIDYINTLQGYEGYVQFSHRPIDVNKDVFRDRDPKVEDEKGFVYEAHFSNGKVSLMIRQVNGAWLLSETDIDNAVCESYVAIDGLKVNMAQIWETNKDALCENMDVKELKKVVFAGFEKGEAS